MANIYTYELITNFWTFHEINGKYCSLKMKGLHEMHSIDIELSSEAVSIFFFGCYIQLKSVFLFLLKENTTTLYPMDPYNFVWFFSGCTAANHRSIFFVVEKTLEVWLAYQYFQFSAIVHFNITNIKQLNFECVEWQKELAQTECYKRNRV